MSADFYSTKMSNSFECFYKLIETLFLIRLRACRCLFSKRNKSINTNTTVGSTPTCRTTACTVSMCACLAIFGASI